MTLYLCTETVTISSRGPTNQSMFTKIAQYKQALHVDELNALSVFPTKDLCTQTILTL